MESFGARGTEVTLLQRVESSAVRATGSDEVESVVDGAAGEV